MRARKGVSDVFTHKQSPSTVGAIGTAEIQQQPPSPNRQPDRLAQAVKGQRWLVGYSLQNRAGLGALGTVVEDFLYSWYS